MNATPPPLDRFRAAIMADPACATALAGEVRPDAFVDRAIAQAATHGIALDRDPLMAAFHPDPLGLARFAATGATQVGCPPRGWIPANIAQSGEGLMLDWLHHAGAPLTRPFFEESVGIARALPLNRLLPVRTPLDALSVLPSDRDNPDGFIFHMSRCGSTLVAQMLAAVPGHVVVSEAAVLDQVLQLMIAGQVGVDRFRGVVRALLRDATGTAQRRFVKLDSWHALAAPHIRRAFPDVPWVFLYRDPVEILVSQQRMAGAQVVRGMVPMITGGDDLHPDAYAAWLLGRIARGACDALDHGGGIAINYRALPDAVATAILPHFGVTLTAAARAAMDAAAHRDAKAPDRAFVPDAAAKQDSATADTRALADRYMADSYARLERLSAAPPR